MTVVIKKCIECGRYDTPTCPFCLAECMIVNLTNTALCTYCGRSREIKWEEEK